jgi:hypothetical protein
LRGENSNRERPLKILGTAFKLPIERKRKTFAKILRSKRTVEKEKSNRVEKG